MENLFQQYEIRIVEREISRKPFAAIAFLLDRTVEEVQAFVQAHFTDTAVDIFQHTRDVRRKPKNEVKVPRPKKAKAPVIISRVITQPRAVEKKPERKFTTRAVDLVECVSVKIDHKTTVYGKPGETEDQIRARFRSNQTKYGLSMKEK